MPGLRLRRLALLAAAIGCLGGLSNNVGAESGLAPTPANDTPATPLTSISDVKRWSELAGQALPIRIEGVVTWTAPAGNFFIHDGRMGIHVRESEAGKQLRPGDSVQVVGRTRKGSFAPSILPLELTPAAPRPMPTPRRATYSEVASGSLDGDWLEFDGIVCAIEVLDGSLPMVALSLAVEGRRLRVHVNNTPPLPLDEIIDTEIRVRGVASGTFNPQRQLVEPVLRCSGRSSLTILRPALEDPFALPLVPVSRILGFSLEVPRPHRIRVRGTITRRISERVFFLRQGSLGLKVESRVAAAYQPGDEVEVAGFPTLSGGTAVMESAVSRVVGSGTPPSPVLPTMPELLSGAHSSNLVRVRARLVDWAVEGSALTFAFESGNHLFKGVLQDGGTLTEHPKRNSIVEVTGICVISELRDVWYFSPRSVLLLISNPNDLRVVQEPDWWTRERLWGALALVLGASATGFGWVWSLRRQVQRKRAIIEQQARRAAALEERSRIARDLHDTLEQALTGLSLQLKAVETDINDAPDKAGVSLDSARQMLRQTRALAQDAIRELRTDTVARRHETLVEGLRRAVDLWIQSGALTIDLRVTGTEQPLPHHMEQHLLGIATEAMTNAVKHGGAHFIRLELGYRPEGIFLRVEDNGHGFDPVNNEARSGGGFGLLGMRERAHQIRGRMTIESQPGSGTLILLEVPLRTAGRSLATASPAPSPVAGVP